jgi:hypothetical protein
MSWEFYDAYADEAFAVVSADFINPKTRETPAGFNLTAMRKDLAQL